MHQRTQNQRFFRTKGGNRSVHSRSQKISVRKSLYEKSVQKQVKHEQKMFKETRLVREIAEKQKITQKSRNLDKKRRKRVFNWLFEVLTNFGEFSEVSAANVDVQTIDTGILSKICLFVRSLIPIYYLYIGICSFL